MTDENEFGDAIWLPDETIAGTDSGIADDAGAPGEDFPTPTSDAEIAGTAQNFDAPMPDAGNSR